VPYGPFEKASPQPPSLPRPTLDRRQRAAVWRQYCWRVISRPIAGEPITLKPLRWPRRSDMYDGPNDPRFGKVADALLASFGRSRPGEDAYLFDLSERLKVWDEYPPCGPHGDSDDTICWYFDTPRLRRAAHFSGRKDDDVTKKIVTFLEANPEAQTPAVLAYLMDLAKRGDAVVLAVAPIGEQRARERLEATKQRVPKPLLGRTVVWERQHDGMPFVMPYEKLKRTVKRVRKRLRSAR
jgi:hypothetical protein